jgi:hypothetical protein
MNEIKRYCFYEIIEIYIPLLNGIEYLSERIQIKDCKFTLFASLDNPYFTDGASPKWIFRNKIIGTYDGKNNELKYPTLVHDIGYEEQFTRRDIIDNIFKYLMEQKELTINEGNTIKLIKVNWRFAKEYYYTVRKIGWIYWYLRKFKKLINKSK